MRITPEQAIPNGTHSSNYRDQSGPEGGAVLESAVSLFHRCDFVLIVHTANTEADGVRENAWLRTVAAACFSANRTIRDLSAGRGNSTESRI
jgi:hypothetical protein